MIPITLVMTLMKVRKRVEAGATAKIPPEAQTPLLKRWTLTGKLRYHLCAVTFIMEFAITIIFSRKLAGNHGN